VQGYFTALEVIDGQNCNEISKTVAKRLNLIKNEKLI